MVEIVLQVIDPGGLADIVSRRIMTDLRDTPGVLDAWLVRRPSVEGERGVIEDIGALGVRLATGGGAEALFGFVRAALGRAADREIVVKLPDGTEFSLKGSDLSDEAFDKATSTLLSMIAGRHRGETA